MNIWGNWKGYLGTRKVEDFGTDEADAKQWLETGSVERPDWRKDPMFKNYKG
jgi:hypothetical protein